MGTMGFAPEFGMEEAEGEEALPLQSLFTTAPEPNATASSETCVGWILPPSLLGPRDVQGPDIKEKLSSHIALSDTFILLVSLTQNLWQWWRLLL